MLADNKGIVGRLWGRGRLIRLLEVKTLKQVCGNPKQGLVWDWAKDEDILKDYEEFKMAFKDGLEGPEKAFMSRFLGSTAVNTLAKDDKFTKVAILDADETTAGAMMPHPATLMD